MIYHYFKVALRYLLRSRTYSFLNLLGLIVGLTTCLLLGAYLFSELQYDQFHEKGESLYRLDTDLEFPDQRVELALAAGPIAPELKNTFPEIQGFIRLAEPWGKLLFQRGDISAFEGHMLYADSTFFTFLDFPLLHGSAETVLREPNTIVLSREKALFYFGVDNPIGEVLSVDNTAYRVVGVAGEVPAGSHIQFDGIMDFQSWEAQHPAARSSWTWTSFPTYLLLGPGADAAALAAKLPQFIEAKMPEEQRGEMNMQLSMEPFESIYFSPVRLGELQSKGSKRQLWFLSVTGLFILFLAVFNYINLTTALYSMRTREIGLRKTLGASSRQVSGQYLAEAVLLCLAAMGLSIAGAALLLPLMEKAMGISIALAGLPWGGAILVLLGCSLLLGLATGAYPALLLSRLSPVSILKERGTILADRAGLRQGLTVAQFTVSIALILGTMVVWQQLKYLSNKSLGFDESGKMVIDFGALSSLPTNYHSIKQELEQLPEVEGVTFSSHVPSESPHAVSATIEKENGQAVTVESELYLVDFDFIELYGLQLIAGRAFESGMSQDTAGALILNRSALEQFGYSAPEAILGRPFQQWEQSGRVIGVVEDFNYKSLHDKVGPITLQINPQQFEKLTIHYAAGHLPSTIQNIEQTWKRLAGGLPFQYSFLDERLQLQYQADYGFAWVLGAFSTIAIVLALVGMVGLVAFTCRREAKNIAIRKVFGATSLRVVLGLLSSFSRPILLAWPLAVLPAWYLARHWLDSYAYHMAFPWWVAIGAGGLVALLAAVVVALQSWRTARANPVRYLMEE